MYDPNKIATVIAVYNDENRIQRAIKSAANSICPTGFVHEVLVVDDASTDGSLAVAQTAAEDFDHVHVVSMPANGGPSDARNYALSKTDAAWFSPIDSDDLVEPQRMATLCRVAAETGAQLVADNLLLSQENTPETVTRVLWPGKPEGQLPLSAELFIKRCYEVELPRSELGFVKPLIDRRAINPPHAPYLKGVRFGEDYELYTRMLLDGAHAVLVDPLGYYLVQRDQSASRSQGAEDHKRLVEINQTFLMRPNLTKEEQAALKGFVSFSRREWAMWAVIGAARNKSMAEALRALSISFDSTAHVLRALIGSIPRRLKGR